MTTNRPITPPPELVQQWLEDSPEDDELGIAGYIATQAARWGADQQLKQDAKWLDSNALYTHELIVSPSGDALRQIMRPKPLSLAEETLTKSAQAVLDAFRAVPDLRDCPSIAAALRAAADQVVPEYETTPGGSKIWPSEPVPSIRAALLAIAAELEGAND